MRNLLLAPVLALVSVSACDVGTLDPDLDNELPIDSFGKSPMFDRVVLGRLYQKDDWTLPQAGSTAGEKVAYVCNVLAPLAPSYVSGLIRLDDDGPLLPDQIAVFQGVRDCVHAVNPQARFDIVLNAEHYTDPQRHPDGLTALRALQHRADELKALGVDVVFFDFFNSPYNTEHVKAGWYADALTRGTDYIRHTLRLKVAGNVWGLDAPPNSDFVALDNFDRPNTDGYVFDKQQIAAFRKKHLPVMLHIENNPQKVGSKGLLFIDGSPDYRRGVVDKFAADQRSEGFAYMFPVFFPLQCCVGTVCGPSHCKDQLSDRPAYDASRDGLMLQKIDTGLGR